MKITTRITSLLILLLMLFLTCACNSKTQTEETTNAEDQTEVETEPQQGLEDSLITSSGDLYYGDNTFSTTVVSSNASFSFLNRIEIEKNATWTLSNDENGQSIIENYSVNLQPGDNTYYIHVKKNDIEETHKVVVHYQNKLTVQFFTNSTTNIETQYIDFGSKVQKPINPVRTNYEFKGWYVDGAIFDFNIAPTKDIVMIAHWERTAGYLKSDTALVTFEDTAASLHLVWKDYADNAKIRPSSVTCKLACTINSEELIYDIQLTKDSVSWVDKDNLLVNSGALLSVGEGPWSLTIHNLPNNCEYSLTQYALSGSYTTKQVGTAVVNTIAGYIPSIDTTSALTTRNSRLYDQAGNLIVIKGVVTLNVGKFDESLSERAIKKLVDIGTNCLRITMQLVGNNNTGYVYLSNGNSRTGDYNDNNATRTTQTIKDNCIKDLESVIDIAVKYGMYVIVDWGILTSNPCQYTNEAIDFFSKLAEDYKDNPYLIYEICNEPVATWGTSNGNNNSIKYYATQVIDAIRAKGSNAVIIVAPNNSATALSVYSGGSTAGDDPIDNPIDDDHAYNIAYTFHCYPFNYKYNETYCWKLRDAYKAGLTIIVTELSPMDGTFDAPDTLCYDLDEAAKFLRMFQEYDTSFCYFRYASYQTTTSTYNENLMFRPFLNLSTRAWTYDDLTTCGKWYYDIVTGSGIFVNPDYTAKRIKDIREEVTESFKSYGLSNIYPGFATNYSKLSADTWLFQIAEDDIISDLQYATYIKTLFDKLSNISPSGVIDAKTSQKLTSSTLPTKRTTIWEAKYNYSGTMYTIKVEYTIDANTEMFGIKVTFSK